MKAPSPLAGRCAILRPDDTRETLVARGLSPAAADEALSFRSYLAARRDGFDGSWQDWKKKPPTGHRPIEG